VLEQSLEQTNQQLVANKAQQEVSEKQNQQGIIEAKQDKQRELDRQAKQYDSMLEHYSNEIGQLKVKLETTEKQQDKDKKELQIQHEKNLVAITELQANVTVLEKSNKQLEKKNKDKTMQIKTQHAELQQLNKDYAVLETRFEVLSTDK
jgi:chromosome segregation ATPase